MTTQQPLPQRPTRPEFARLVVDVFKSRADQKQTIAYALNIGVNPRNLIDYVRGKLTNYERAEVQSDLTKSTWAMSRAVALVKAQRNPASLGARILTSTHINPYDWGMENTGDEDVDLCLLLDKIE